MRFGDILRELLDEKDITQAKFAEDLNLRSSAVGHYVRNEREPDFELLKAFSSYFHVSVDYLLGNTTQNEYQLSADEQSLLRKYRSLHPEQKEICQFMTHGLIMQNQRKEK